MCMDQSILTRISVLVVAKLTYAASAWWDFTSADDRRRIEAVLRRGLRAGFYQSYWPTVAQLIQNNDDTFFHRVLSCSIHVLHCLLPDKRSHVYQLRSRPHDCILTANNDTRNFLYRLLHCDIYWFVTLLFFLFHCLRCVMSSFLLNEYMLYIYIVTCCVGVKLNRTDNIIGCMENIPCILVSIRLSHSFVGRTSWMLHMSRCYSFITPSGSIIHIYSQYKWKNMQIISQPILKHRTHTEQYSNKSKNILIS